MSSSGAPNTRRTLSCWSGPEEGHKDDQRAGEPPLQEQAESWNCEEEKVSNTTREVVDVPSLEAFKARLDGALSNLSWWVGTLPMTEALELDDA